MDRSVEQPGSDQSRVRADRRTVLRSACAFALGGGAVATLAACGGGSTTTTSPTAAGSATAPASEPPSSSGTPGESETPSSEPSATKAPSGPSVATADVPVGGGVVFDDYVVTQPEEGTFRAFTRTCTHQGRQISAVTEGAIVCPFHGSAFSMEDGSVVNPPATRPLREYETTVSGSKVYLAV